MTKPEQSEGDRSRDQLLAGEYVLGTLSLDDRRKVEQRLQRDKAFAAIVANWQENLSGFDEYDDDDVPVRRAVVAAKARPAPKKSFAQELAAKRSGWRSLALWRGLTFCSVGVFAAYVAFDLGLIGPLNQPAPLVADLKADSGNVGLLASYDAAFGNLRITPVAAAAGGDRRSLQVWIMPQGDQPAVSLGILPQSAGGALDVRSDLRDRMAEGVTLAVSVEPFGGSPTGAPTGPVIATGQARKP